MSKKLLIVESPAKAKTIGKYLGGEFVVKSSVGHIRDLPKENGAIKVVEKGPGKWEFTPTYVVSEGKTKVVAELKAATKAADEIYLASDPDREGEAIAWHLHEAKKWQSDLIFVPFPIRWFHLKPEEVKYYLDWKMYPVN